MSDIIDVWFVPLDTPAGAGSSCADILTDEELDRAARFRKPRDRSRWAASRLALRTILATWTSVDARHVALVNGDNGKPRLLPNAHTASPYFNLSHSGAAALVAVTPRFALGVDIEQERSFADMLRVADRVFTVNERAELAALSEKEFVRAFFTAWTRKEALIKATGAGLSTDLQSVEVTLLPGVAPRVIRMGDDDQDAWQLFDIDTASPYRAALAARTDANIEITMHRLDL